MNSAELIRLKLERILPLVEKPGRYVGGEYNSITKDWDETYTKVALVFPDIYDIGLSNLGIQILYERINELDNCLAERSYSPWKDMEELLRHNQIPLFTLESKNPLIEFDILGFTLPYETLYTNALNILDLSGIPIRSNERDTGYPLIIAGGHATYNPEPMAPFIDVFIIGEGENVMEEVIQTYQSWKKIKTSKIILLNQLSEIPGIYVPSLYLPKYNPDGIIQKIDTLNKTAPKRITKRIVGKLPYAPTRFLVPSINVVHNRVAVEIMRGCTRGCRFCHAGMINRPVRERSVSEILNTIEQSLANTGFEEVALLSLSSSDYSQILKLVEEITEKFAGKNLTISLPSLRIESFSADLMEKLRGSGKGGFTLAPEAATEKMRNIINKPISEELLLETAQEIFKRGWHTIKLYFMIGHPLESMEDVLEIGILCKKVLSLGIKTIGRRAKVHAGISSFVPKPHTPFQWVQCDSIDTIREKQKLLRETMRVPGIKINWTDPYDTMLEATLSRGDRRISDVIEKAWKNGAKFDAWQDSKNYQIWKSAFEECNLNPDFYSHRIRNLNEIFPWDHINPGVKKSYLELEYKNSLILKLRPDCRQQCYACGITQSFNDLRKFNPEITWYCPKPGR